MKPLLKFASATWLVLILTVSAHADGLRPNEAIQHVGEHAIIEGVVAQVSRSRGGTTFINFGGRYPNHIFYAVIFKKHAGEFPNIFKLEGRVVAIEGTIKMYKGKPQIILTSPSQIAVKEEASNP